MHANMFKASILSNGRMTHSRGSRQPQTTSGRPNKRKSQQIFFETVTRRVFGKDKEKVRMGLEYGPAHRRSRLELSTASLDIRGSSATGNHEFCTRSSDRKQVDHFGIGICCLRDDRHVPLSKRDRQQPRIRTRDCEIKIMNKGKSH